MAFDASDMYLMEQNRAASSITGFAGCGSKVRWLLIQKLLLKGLWAA
jgi:hypothetical protein